MAMSGLRMKDMRKDIDFVDYEGNDLVDDRGWITPSHVKGYRKIRLSDSIAVYYRYSNQYVFFNIVLSFDCLGAHSPKKLPSLFYAFLDMLDTWEKLGADSEEDSE
jgi:hypothetical protein